MSCSNFSSLGESWRAWRFVEGFVCTYAVALEGLQVFAMLVYLGVGGAIWIRTRSIAIPANLILLLGSVALTQMATPGSQVAAVVLLLAFGFGTVLIVRRVNG